MSGWRTNQSAGLSDRRFVAHTRSAPVGNPPVTWAVNCSDPPARVVSMTGLDAELAGALRVGELPQARSPESSPLAASTYCQPTLVNWVTWAMLQVCLPTLYHPDQGWLATISPVVWKGRPGGRAAISGQLMYPVIRPST